MSGSVGTMRAGTNKQNMAKDKISKNEKNSQQLTTGKSESQSKNQPTQEQIRLAQMMGSNQNDVDPSTVHELMELTGKSEEDVVIALHDAQNDANRAVMMLLEGGDEQQGEWREQGGKRKKKSNTSALKESNHTGDDPFEGRQKDRGDRENKDSNGPDRGDAPPRRGGRRNGGPPPRLARGRGRDRGNFGDRENNRDRSNTDENWDNDRGDDKRDRGGSDRGRSRGRGGFGGGRGRGAGSTGGRGGRFANSNDRDGSRGFNRVPRFEKMNNSQNVDYGPEIDTWTNETAESKTVSKDNDWNNWSDTWVNEEDQWTGTLEETKVFTPSTLKMPEPESVLSDPPSSLGQRVDVVSLFESAKFSRAPDYSKPSGDAFINQFNQAATESIKSSIGIGSSPRGPQSLNSLNMGQQPSTNNSLGLSSLAESTAGVLSSLPEPESPSSMTQMSQISQSASQAMSQIGGMSSQPAQSRLPSMLHQQNQQGHGNPVNMNAGNFQQRPKPQRSKLPPPSKIPASAVEMPGHLTRNTQLDLQFGIDFGSESNASFGFGADDTSVVTSTYATTSNGGSSVISNHLNQSHTASKVVPESNNAMVSGLMSSPSAGSNAVQSPIDLQQNNRSATVFHNSVYTASSPKNDSQGLDRDQNKLGSDPMNFSSSQMDRKSPMMSQRIAQPSQNINSGSLGQSKNDGPSNFSSSNGYPSSYPNHQKSTSISNSQSSFNHSSGSQPHQSSPFPGQYPASQSAFPSSGQNQFGGPTGSSQFPPPLGQPPHFNNAPNQYSSSSSSSGQNQFPSSGSSSSHASMPHGTNHQSQYSSGPQNSYGSSSSSGVAGGQNQYPGYQNNSGGPFPARPPSSNNSYQSANSNSSLYPATTQSGSSSSYTPQPNAYQSPSAGSYNTRDNQHASSNTHSTHANSGVNFPNPPQGLSSLKSSNSQTNTNYNSQSFSANPAPLPTSALGDSLSKMTLKDNASLESHQTSQFDPTSPSTTSVSTSLSLPSTTSPAVLSSGTSTISSTTTATTITSTSRIASMPSTSKAPPNLPPGVPLMGHQYIMSQNTMPPFYSVPPMYGFEDMQLLQQRMPLQTGSYFDMSAFPAPPVSTLPTGRDQQPPIPNVPFTGASGDSTKVPRVDAQSPNSANQPQNAHSASQPFFNFHYGYYYPSMFPGTAGLQYPMFPMPPVTNAAAHAGTTATTQFQKSYPSHVYTSNKGYDELNQAQDFSKTGYGSSTNAGKTSGTRTGMSEMTPNAYNKPHSQGFDKQGFHGGTPPPYNLPLANATQSGPMGGPTNPYGAAPFLPVMAAHQPHSQMIHHPMQQALSHLSMFFKQESGGSSNLRGMNQTGTQPKAGAGKSYGGAPTYWNN